jgi:nucleoside-diphosphate-sugar epimerase
MPLWVFLDCCTLPSAMFGFEVPRDALPAAWADALDPGGRLGWVGVSEYVGLPSAVPGRLVGVSLFSLAHGHRLGTRSKALGLLAMRATSHVGVAQYRNAAVRLHLHFDDLEVTAARAPVHSRPDETFVYRCGVPDPGRLLAMVRGHGIERRERAPRPVTHRFDPRIAESLDLFRELARHHVVRLVGAGEVVDGALSEVLVHAEPAGEVVAGGAVAPTGPGPAPGGVRQGAARGDDPVERWLLVGAGYSAEALGRRAVARGAQVWGTTRRASRAGELSAAGILPVQVDFAADATLAVLPSLEGARVLVSVPPEAGASPHRALERALEWAEQAGAGDLYYLSATSVYAEDAGGEVDDDAPVLGRPGRGRRRVEAEAIVREFGSRRRARTFIVRLPGIYGPDRTMLPRLRDGSYRLVGDGAMWTNRIHVDDIAGVIEFIDGSGLDSRTLLASDGRPFRVRELVERCCGELGYAFPPSVGIDEVPESTREFWLGSKRCRPRVLERLGWKPTWPDAIEAHVAIGRAGDGWTPG